MKPLSVPERLAKNRFNLNEEESHIEYAACLECGTCLAIALKWHYPLGGFGVQFREG
jgi:ferredoxin-like protein FixX